MARRGENIRKRNDRRWEGRYVQRENGKSKVCSVYGKTYRETREKLLTAKTRNLEELLWNEKIESNDMILFDEIAERWLCFTKQEKKYSTYAKYLSIYEKHLKMPLGNMPIQEISTDSIANTLPENLSCSSIKSIYCVLNQILLFGTEHYNLPMQRLKSGYGAASKRSIKILDISEQARLIHFLMQDIDTYKMGIYFCLTTGLRLGEICALKWNDIDLNMRVLHVGRTVQRIPCESGETRTMLLEGTPKTECSIREIPIADSLYLLLKENYCSEGYFIKGNAPMDPRSYQKKFRSYLDAVGITRTNFHTLRHTFATNCIASGADVKSVSEMLGHSNVEITLNRYVHPTIDLKRNQLNLLSAIYGQYVGQVS